MNISGHPTLGSMQYLKDSEVLRRGCALQLGALFLAGDGACGQLGHQQVWPACQAGVECQQGGL